MHAGIYLLEEGEIKKYTHIRIRDYMGLRGHGYGCGGEGIFYLGQTRRPGAHQDEKSKETYHVYVYTRPARCHTRTQQMTCIRQRLKTRSAKEALLAMI